MKKVILLLMIACLAGCSYFVSMDELARNIQAQMQREFNSNQHYQHYHLTVQNVKIVQRRGNQFQAIAYLNYQGEDYPLNLEIHKVNGGYSWSIEEDGFAFIDEMEIEKYRQQLDRELQQLTLALDNLNAADKTESTASSAYVRPAAEPALPRVSAKEEPIPVGNITAYTQ